MLTPIRPGAAPTLEEIPFRAADGLRLGLRRVVAAEADRPAVLLVHGHGVSSDMFLAPEIRTVVDALLDAGYQPWLLDWRGSSRLPYNASGPRFSFDDVALYDLPGAVEEIRLRIGDRPLFVVAHCVGALALSMSMAAGLLPGLAGVVAQGVFLPRK
jgi:cholesterol oxidase